MKERLVGVQYIVPFVKKSWSMMKVDLISV